MTEQGKQPSSSNPEANFATEEENVVLKREPLLIRHE
jgi:hypothetical protein